MRTLNAFLFTSINGFYKDSANDISWHRHGEEESAFSEENIALEHMILFGRITYEMMAGFWASPMAFENLPKVAEGMNKAEKMVFSRTLKKADWQNTRLIKDNLVEEISRLKQTEGKDITILGSGTLVTQLADAGLIDRYDLMVDPVALGAGTPLFQGIKEPLNLELINTRIFKSGTVLLSYIPS